MPRRFVTFNMIVLGVLTLLLVYNQQGVCAAERVQFESARYLPGSLQVRLARERGETPVPPPADIIDGYLVKPQGTGPFAALVYLHGCGGLPKAFKEGDTSGGYSERLAEWGYVVLVVDSFTSRGIKQSCAGASVSRLADALGALSYLARQPFVNPDRVGVIGFSQGAIAALQAVSRRETLFEHEADLTFRAAVAFYPLCETDRTIVAPALILIGALDDWTPASACKAMIAARSGATVPVNLVVYPSAFHAFDVSALQSGREYFGHHLQYDAAAADEASKEVRQFLARDLGR